jgi:hypothetical protein
VSAVETLPSIVHDSVDAPRIARGDFSFVLLPLAGAALGWMEGRLKLR